jgi:hypothetical protein
MVIYRGPTYIAVVEDELVFEPAAHGLQDFGCLGYYLGSDAVTREDGDIAFHQRLLFFSFALSLSKGG